MLGAQNSIESAGLGPELGAMLPDLAGRLGPRDQQLGVAIFTTKSCRPCQDLKPVFGRLGNDPQLAVGTFDNTAERELWRALRIPGGPFVIVLETDGRVLAKDIVNTTADLEAVIESAALRR